MDQPRQIRRRYVRQPALAREVRPSARRQGHAAEGARCRPACVHEPRRASSHSTSACVPRIGRPTRCTGIEWENESTQGRKRSTQWHTHTQTHTVTAKGSFSRRPRRRAGRDSEGTAGGPRGGRRGWGTSMDVRPTRVCFARRGRGRETLRESGGQRDSERDSERERE